MSLYTRLKASLTESICLMKHLEEEDIDEMVDFNYVLSEAEEQVLELQNELGKKDAEIKELNSKYKWLKEKYEEDTGFVIGRS